MIVPTALLPIALLPVALLPIALLIAAQAAPATDPPPVVPTDFAALPPVPWKAPPKITPDIAAFVAQEVKAGRCTTARPPLELELAVLLRADGGVRRVVPRAIDCPTVEQFGAGLVTRFARDNLRAAGAGWYRTSLSFAWSP